MAAFATFIGYSISIRAIEVNFIVFIAMIVAFIVCGAGQAINDYFDKEIDKKLHPEKPIPSGNFKAKNALYYSIILFLAGNIFAFLFLNEIALYISAGFSILLIVYSAFLKKHKYFGNWVVAGGTAFTLIFGASMNGISNAVVLLSVSALLSNVCREITKDFEDLEADKGFKKSLPMIMRKEKIETAVFGMYSIAMLLPYWLFSQGIYGNIYFIAIVSGANLLFLAAFNDLKNGNFSKSQNFAKKGMLIALIGFFAGII